MKGNGIRCRCRGISCSLLIGRAAGGAIPECRITIPVRTVAVLGLYLTCHSGRSRSSTAATAPCSSSLVQQLPQHCPGSVHGYARPEGDVRGSRWQCVERSCSRDPEHALTLHPSPESCIKLFAERSLELHGWPCVECVTRPQSTPLGFHTTWALLGRGRGVRCDYTQ